MFAIDPTEIFEYIPKQDENAPEEFQTKFELKVLSERELRQIEKGMKFNVKTNEVNITDREVEYRALKLGLRGWSNFKLRNGDSVEFAADGKGQPTDQSIDWIPPNVRTELTNVITTGSQFKEEDAKN